LFLEYFRRIFSFWEDIGMDDLWFALIAVALGYCVELVMKYRDIDQLIRNATVTPFLAVAFSGLAWWFLPSSFLLVKSTYIGVLLAILFHQIPQIARHRNN
jgi:hypothetical protein